MILRLGCARNEHDCEAEAKCENNLATLPTESPLDGASCDVRAGAGNEGVAERHGARTTISRFCRQSNVSAAAAGRLSMRCHLFAQFLLARRSVYRDHDHRQYRWSHRVPKIV